MINTENSTLQTVNKFQSEELQLKDSINVSIISTHNKVGKSMFMNLLWQTGFINRNIIFRKDEFTFINDKSIMIRKISSKNCRLKNLFLFK
jgi:hypothetical protein